jgi:heme exporter protein B
MLQEIRFLLQKEMVLEYRQKYAFSGLLLYTISTIFICYLSFKGLIDVPGWNALYWVIMLFASVNAIAKSFIAESKGRHLYMYSLASPQAVIVSKIIYNLLLMLVLSAINYTFYSLFLGNPVQDKLMFLVCLLLGSAGFSIVLTMVSSIASKAGNNATLMAVLSFPLLIPFMISLIRLSKNAIDGLDYSVDYPLILILAAINLIVLILSFILFPYLWRE